MSPKDLQILLAMAMKVRWSVSTDQPWKKETCGLLNVSFVSRQNRQNKWVRVPLWLESDEEFKQEQLLQNY